MPGNASYPDPKFPLTRYLGKICAKHPELLGSRRRTSGSCHGCQMDRNKKNRLKPETQFARALQARETRAENKENIAVARAIHSSAHTKIKAHARELAKAAGESPNRDWPAYYQRSVDSLREDGIIPKDSK